MLDASVAVVEVVPDVNEETLVDDATVDNGETVDKKETFVTYDKFKSMAPEEKAEVFVLEGCGVSIQYTIWLVCSFMILTMLRMHMRSWKKLN